MQRFDPFIQSIPRPRLSLCPHGLMLACNTTDPRDHDSTDLKFFTSTSSTTSTASSLASLPFPT